MKSFKEITFGAAAEQRYSVIFFTAQLPKKLGQCVIVEGRTEGHVADALTLKLGYNVNIMEIEEGNYLINLGDRTYSAYIFLDLGIVGMVKAKTLN